MSLPKLQSTRYLRAGKLSSEIQHLHAYVRQNPSKAEELAEYLSGVADVLTTINPKKEIKNERSSAQVVA